jgi:hypothetical protein
MSANQNTQSNDIEKVIYFIILRPIEEKAQLDIKFSSEIAPQRIYIKKKKILKKKMFPLLNIMYLN